jgi:hypothetical protein
MNGSSCLKYVAFIFERDLEYLEKDYLGQFD